MDIELTDAEARTTWQPFSLHAYHRLEEAHWYGHIGKRVFYCKDCDLFCQATTDPSAIDYWMG